MSILAPCKWSMVFAKYCRYCFIIFVLKQVYDQKSCIFLIFFKFFAFQTACTWNLTINIICMCGSITWDCSSGLCPACCPWRMCMYNSSDIRECFVQFYMSCCIRRWIIFSFYLISIQVYNNHIIRCQQIIINSTWFDDKKSWFSVDSAYISPCKCNKSVFWKIHVCFVNFLF